MVHSGGGLILSDVDPSPLAITSLLRSGDPRPAPRCLFFHLVSVTVRQDTVWERHRHADHELILVEAGDYRCRLNGHELRLGPGQALVVQPDDWHEDLLDAGVRYHALVCELEAGPLFLPASAPAARIASATWPEWDGLLAPLRRAVAVADPLTVVQDAALVPLFWRVVAALDGAALAAPYAPGDPDARLIRQAFERRLGEPIGIAQLAADLGWSERSFDRRCRAALGLPPARALARHRLDRAAHLLRHTAWPIKHIADAVGFANPFHFTRSFALRFGVPPTRYRQGGGNR